jgi:hypothetical protein
MISTFLSSEPQFHGFPFGQRGLGSSIDGTLLQFYFILLVGAVEFIQRGTALWRHADLICIALGGATELLRAWRRWIICIAHDVAGEFLYRI